MRPKGSSAVYRPDLGMSVMEMVEGDTMGFIGLEVMPVFRTSVNGATYPVIPKEALLSAPDADRAPRGKYQRDDWDYERGQFQTAEKGVEEPLDDTERELFDQEEQGMAEMMATQRAYKKILRSQEKRIAQKMFNETNFIPHPVTNEWDDAAAATPLDDVAAGIAAFRLQCGMLPDALIIAYSTFQNLKNCDQLVDRIKFTFQGLDIAKMSAAQLAGAFNLPRVLVGGAVFNSAGKGMDANVADLWNNEYAQLVKISSGPDISQPGVGRTFLWTADSPQNPIVESYREEKIRSDIFRVRHHVDEAFIQSKNDTGAVVSNIAAACQYLFSNITTHP
ncbi:hypothetical protein [uncultured Desulfosarcina sp.]|uniref:hypothetical protein n=1 Tax=uncultured Desulfosarcina sp. TaxID=218289 RepID=UPI0029C6D8A4|nr:hypothetical protein [uncultured Desulfosarcina sp.]